MTSITVSQLLDALGHIQDAEKSHYRVYATNFRGIFPVRSVIIDHKYRELCLDISEDENAEAGAKAS